MTTFPQVLSGLLARDAGRPLVTFYDDATGERTELSVTTYANWVAKVASLLVDELEIEHGSRLRVDLPAHWLAPVVMGAAWAGGLEVVWDGAADGVVTGPDGVDRWAEEASSIPVVASALLPLAVRFPEPLPGGVHDLGVEVWSQPDAYVAWPAPTEDDRAVPGLTQHELWSAAAVGSIVTDGGRLLSETSPASPSGLASFIEPLARGGSMVLVTHASEHRREQIAADERVTARFDPGQPARS
jgi:uncharacterized protein (TIGR03089 family)